MKANPSYKGKWYAPMIDNPAYIGEWAPRKIPNPNYFEDLNPVKSLNKIVSVQASVIDLIQLIMALKQGGVGIELWTMTEDILFDNIYIGHSLEDAKVLKAETFDVKKPLEEAQSKAKKPEPLDDEEELTFWEDPIEFLRTKAFKFVDLAQLDPILAVKTQPEVGAVLALAVVTLFGMLGMAFGLIGGSQKPVTKVHILAVPETSPSRMLTRLHSHQRRRTRPHPTTSRNPSLHLSRLRAVRRQTPL